MCDICNDLYMSCEGHNVIEVEGVLSLGVSCWFDTYVKRGTGDMMVAWRWRIVNDCWVSFDAVVF